MFYRLRKYFSYQCRAIGRYSVHSPFVYDFVTKVVNEKKIPDECLKIEAGLKAIKPASGKNAISAARARFVARRDGRLLFRIAAYFKPFSMLAFGPNTGTIYLTGGWQEAHLIGVDELSGSLRSFIDRYRFLIQNKITLMEGSSESVLPALIRAHNRIDLAFVASADLLQLFFAHREEVFSCIHNETILLVYGIHCSPKATRDWEEIAGWPGVTVSMDLFNLGIIFFRNELSRQHFIIRY